MSKETALKVAWHFLGTPYKWGGDDPMKGFDCSGFVIEILKSVGKLPRRGDWTANTLRNMFNDREVGKPYAGCLVFYGSERRATHIEFMLDEALAIGASGGGSRTKTEQDAVDQNAYIKVRPFDGRSDVIGFVDPWLSF